MLRSAMGRRRLAMRDADTEEVTRCAEIFDGRVARGIFDGRTSRLPGGEVTRGGRVLSGVGRRAALFVGRAAGLGARWTGLAGSPGERLDKTVAGRRAEVRRGRAMRGDLGGFVNARSGKAVQPAANTGHRQGFAFRAKSAGGSPAVVGFAS